VNIGEVCSRDVCIVTSAEPLGDAVAEMQKHHVGALVVIERRQDQVRPIGIITDRDVIRSQVVEKKGLSRLTVADAMTAHLLTLPESCGIAEAIGQMSTRGVRRAPVVNDSGDLVGVVSFDDLLPVVSEQLNVLAKLISDQPRRESGG